MKVISLLSRKGGSGKNTLAMHWAVEAGKKKKSVTKKIVILDLDPQGSCASWYEKRESGYPFLISSSPKELPDHLALCRKEKVDLVIIDTVPDINAVAVHAARFSDLVVIPTRPSVLDLEALAGSVELVEGLKKQAVIVINQTPVRSRVEKEAREALGGYNLPVCPTAIIQRLSFSRHLIRGKTAGEAEPKSKAAIEIRKTWSWVQKQLEA